MDDNDRKPAHFSALIPFAGFYETPHTEHIDYAEEQLFADDSGEILCQKLYEMFWLNISYRQVFNKYAKAYVEALGEELGIHFDYEEMVSPREYNFTTDRLFAKISRSDLARLLRAVRGKPLDAKIAELFTSRSGFISHYPNHISRWPRIAEWDHNHVGCVLACYVDQLRAKRTLRDEFSIAQDWIGDDAVQEWLDEAAEGSAARALRINDYLIRRQERRFAISA
jgi:hypothetical protein